MTGDGVESRDAETDTVDGVGSKGVVDEADAVDGVESIVDIFDATVALCRWATGCRTKAWNQRTQKQTR